MHDARCSHTAQHTHMGDGVAFGSRVASQKRRDTFFTYYRSADSGERAEPTPCLAPHNSQHRSESPRGEGKERKATIRAR